MKAAMKILIGSGAAYNLDLGFEPDYVEIEMVDTATNTDRYIWCGRSQQEHATCVTDSTEYGIIIKEGVTSIGDTVAKGISLYDGSKTPRVRIPAYDGDGLSETDVYGDYSTTADYSSVGTARSTSALGTVVRPTTHNGYVYELTTAGGTDSTEPTWPTTPGDSVDGGNNVWICRKEDIVGSGKGKGITLGATLLESGAVFFIKAYKFDHIEDLGTPS